MSEIKPYNTSSSKKSEVIKMFNNISSSYDILNQSLSFGMHHSWRKKAIFHLEKQTKNILDIATGTADFAISAAKYTKANITGVDISDGMLKIGKKKIQENKLEKRINLSIADSENLPFDENQFDAVTVGFGVRNFENRKKGLEEIYRVLKKEGKLLILEPSSPQIFPLKQIYNLYFSHITPLFGRIVSKDQRAYSYLPESVKAFPSSKEFIKELKNVGFKACKQISFTFGSVVLYIAIK